MLAVHIQSFASVEAARMNPTVYGDLRGANWWVWLTTYTLADGKFIAIFAMLFGAAIVMQSTRAGVGPFAAHRHYRRMAVLFVLGIIHGYVLWYGDMLVGFAVCGAIAFVYRDEPLGRLIWRGLVWFVLGAAIMLASSWPFSWWSPEALARQAQSWAPSSEAIAWEIERYRGGWLDQMAHRVPAAFHGHTSGLAFRTLWQMVGLILMGMGLFKLDVLSGARPAALYGAMAAVGFGAGVPLTLVGVHHSFAHGWDLKDFLVFGSFCYYFGALLVGLGWTGLTLLVCRRWTSVSPLAAVGRLALTNYLLQSVVCTTIFYGHGFGLFARLDRVDQLGVVAGVWVLQQAKVVVVPFSQLVPDAFDGTADVLSLRLQTRIGTNPDGTKCAGPGGSHNNAVGLRVYFDSVSRNARFGAAQ